MLLPDEPILFCDANGIVIIVEWIGFKKRIIPIQHNKLNITNFLLLAPKKDGYPCNSYKAIGENLNRLKGLEVPTDLKMIGEAITPAAQTPRQDKSGRTLGTLYTSFINVTDVKFTLIYKLDSLKVTELDLNSEFKRTNAQTLIVKSKLFR